MGQKESLDTEIAEHKVVEIMRSDRFCMLTSIAENDHLESHPMTPQETTDEGDVWFFIDTTSEHADNLRAHPHVNIAYADSSTWLSVSGTAELREDRAKVEELWNDMVEAWFPEGRDSPEVGLVFVLADSAKYWGAPGGRVASAVQFVKTKFTGDRPSGHSETVEL